MIIREDSLLPGHDQVTLLRLDHGKANAIDLELFVELEARLDELAVEGRPIVLTGTGTAFSAGVQLFRVLEGGADYLRAFLPRLSSTLRRLFALPQPVVAAINGHAIAGGCILAAACDHRVLARGNARLGVTELLVGVPFPVTPLEVMRFLLPNPVLQRLVYSGQTVPPEEALAMGLVDELAEPEDVVARAADVAETLGRIPRDSFATTKLHLRRPALERIDRDGPVLDPQCFEVWARPETMETIRRFLDANVSRKG